MRLLIAERDEMERAGIKWLVSAYNLGFTHIDEAVDAETLLRTVENRTPDILCVELDMIPSASWHVFVRTVQRYAHTVIAFTAEAVFERAMQAIELHAVQLLLKPLSPDQLKHTIGRAVQRLKRTNRLSQETADAHSQSDSASFAALFVEEASPLPIHLMYVQPERSREKSSLADWLTKYPFLYEPSVFPLSDGVILHFPSQIEQPAQYLRTEARRLLLEWEERGRGRLAAGIHLGTESSARSLHEAYKMTKNVLSMRFFRGHQQLLWAHEMPELLPLDPFLTPFEQRTWNTMLEQSDKAAVKSWMYQQFTEFPQGYPQPDMLRIRLTSILAHLRRFMQTYRLDERSQYEARYHDVFQTILYGPVLFRIVQEMLLFTFTLIDAAEAQREQAMGDFVERGLQYIDRHYNNPNLSLEEVAGFVGRSASYFSQVFSQRKKKTFRQYLTETRIQRAKLLLQNDEHHIQEVAYAVGYTDANYFSRVFKEATGLSPRAWRNINIKK